ncbi:8401_t:CDS:2 [Ambispora leptoticha]|uniref:8401_t:CDS:1 n=1 Tax=Ambispora leptoticha TaxID=144679 RepID=A0A9N8V5Y9_9GLOM|nr:8401_t:CDS:2 [Ambispora leptoticha]
MENVGSFGDFIVDELGGGKFCSQKCENERDEKEDLKALREMKRQHKLSPHLVTPLTLEQEKLLKQLETKYEGNEKEKSSFQRRIEGIAIKHPVQLHREVNEEAKRELGYEFAKKDIEKLLDFMKKLLSSRN